ncbi:unnamed protein product [Rhizopus stolonifer]
MKSSYNPQDIYLCQPEAQFYEETEQELISISQNLSFEQHQFKFPTEKSLRELAYLDHGENQYSFFDLCSFNAAEQVSAEDQMDNSPWHETVVDDSRLSPLHLPLRACRSREMSCESSLTAKQSIPVNPSSFLSRGDMQTDSYYLDSESVSSFDNSTLKTNDTRILIQLNKHNYDSPITIIRHSRSTASISDEGYDDTEDEGKELESECCFYSIQNDEELDRDQAAIKIQSLWRGYISRRNNQHTLISHITRLYGSFHHHQTKTLQTKMSQMEKKMEKMSQMEKRLEQLEKRLEQETAMRRAFENTVENMTILIDQQQKVLHDRLDDEVLMRQSYESKMKEALDKIEPLEACLKMESKARKHTEKMMHTIMDKLQEAETDRMQAAEERKLMQSKIDNATEQIIQLKKNNNTVSTKTSKKETKPVTTLTSKKDKKETKTPINTTLRRQPIVTPVEKPNRRTTITPAKKTLSRK